MKEIRESAVDKKTLGKRKRADEGEQTSWYKNVCDIAERWANERHGAAVEDAAKAFTTPEDATVKKYVTGGKGWASKRNQPTANMSNRMANQLREMYNEQNPHCSPDDAATRLHAMKEYKGSLYVKLVMRADKIKVFFSGLKAKKVNGAVPVLNLKKAAGGYKQFTTVPAMRGEYERRLRAGTIVKQIRMPTKKEQWATLLHLNDIDIENTVTMDDEEMNHESTLHEDEDEGEHDIDVEGGDGDELTMEEALGQHDLLGDDTLS